MTVSEVDRRRAPMSLERERYSRIPEVLPIPDLIELQRKSYDWFVERGLRDLLDEISPIQDFTGKSMELHFNDYEFGEPKYDELECRARDLTFSRPLYVDVELVINETGELIQQRVFMGDFPLMTERGTFIINGTERVVVSQLIRSPGRLLHRRGGPQHRPRAGRRQADPQPRRLAGVRDRRRESVSVKVDRKRKLPVDHPAARHGFGTDDEILRPLRRRRHRSRSLRHRDPRARRHAPRSRRRCSSSTRSCARRSADLDNAKSFVQNLFFNRATLRSGRVGRYKLNRAASWPIGPSSSCRVDAASPRTIVAHRRAHHRASTTARRRRMTSITWATAASRRSAS